MEIEKPADIGLIIDTSVIVDSNSTQNLIAFESNQDRKIKIINLTRCEKKKKIISKKIVEITEPSSENAAMKA